MDLVAVGIQLIPTATIILNQVNLNLVNPKSYIRRGDVVAHKSDQRHGVIVGKRYISNPLHSGGPHDCWLYEVRFASKELNSPLQLVEDVGEFELDKVENK